MKRYKSFYNDFFLNNNLNIFIVDPDDGRILDVNKAAIKFYGYSKEEFLKLTIFDINILSKDEILSKMKLAKEGKKNLFNFKHRIKSGDIREVSVSSNKVNFEDEERLYSVITDVTETNEEKGDLKEKKIKQEMIIGQNPSFLLICHMKFEHL